MKKINSPTQRISRHARRGFTIVELTVVIAVIGILAAITIVSYGGVRRQAIISAQQSDLDTLAQTYTLNAAQNPRLTPTNASTWRSVLEDSGLYNDISRDGINTSKSVMICAKGDTYVLGGWQPLQIHESEAREVSAVVNGKLKQFTWNHATTGSTTLEKFCKQANTAFSLDLGATSATTGSFWTWMHNDVIRSAPLQ